MKYISIFFTLFLFAIFSCNKDLPIAEANFELDKNVAITGELITISNLSINGTEYEWNFGDGKPMIKDEHPTYQYESPGQYNITLKAIGSGGSTEATKIMDIEEPYIYDGKKWGGCIINDTWGNVKKNIEDKWMLERSSKNQYNDRYSLSIKLLNKGVWLNLSSKNSTIDDNDILQQVIDLNFNGANQNGIRYESDYNLIKEYYGDPDAKDKINYSNAWWYFYDGVAFVHQRGKVIGISIFSSFTNEGSQLKFSSTVVHSKAEFDAYKKRIINNVSQNIYQ
ncbi:PKD domain-containing protein [Marinifilum sp.]|uniref:PKD domain-containing protein n=1 Tax=Marinifilum sp. TaxID=2033137 RepID=UPI003BA953AD